MALLFTLALLAQFASAASVFSSEASALMSEYIPSPIYSQLLTSVASAASAAYVTGDPSALFFSAMAVDPRPPAWFSSAMPSSYAVPIAALESALADLRLPKDTGTAVPSGIETVLVTVMAVTVTGNALPTSTSGATTLRINGDVVRQLTVLAILAVLTALTVLIGLAIAL